MSAALEALRAVTPFQHGEMSKRDGGRLSNRFYVDVRRVVAACAGDLLSVANIGQQKKGVEAHACRHSTALAAAPGLPQGRSCTAR